jgi:putative effector of murein hydrolase LrgA (UPF0299 family)
MPYKIILNIAMLLVCLAIGAIAILSHVQFFVAYALAGCGVLFMALAFERDK